MLKFFCRMMFKAGGWKLGTLPPKDLRLCVLVGAPHTSNWDFVYAMAAADYMKLPRPRFTIKKEWMRFPLNLVMGPLGAIPIDRSAKKDDESRVSMVDQMVNFLETADEVTVMVTPEGTRSPVKRWRTGFYQVALKAKVPILLSYLDYAKREAGIGMVFQPTGDLDADMRIIWDFYNQITPRHPAGYMKL